MRRFPLVRVLIVALLLAFVPQIASAQSVSTSSPPPIRDAQAIAVLQSAILGMGGTQSIAAIQDSTIEGTQQNPTNPQAAPLTFTWQQSGAEFRDFIQATDHTYTSLSGHGNPAQQLKGQWSRLNYHVARANLPFELPALVLYRELENATYTLHYIGLTTVEGKSALHLRTSDDTDKVGTLVTPQEWYFDPVSFIPIRVEYRVPYPRNAYQWTPVSIDYKNYQTQNGVLIPFELDMNPSSGRVADPSARHRSKPMHD
jgi:hypothetical protein